MASPIEDIIEEIEEYIDGCKSSAFSSSKIIVNRDEIEGLIHTLKLKIPTEISKYQKIINNRDNIIKDAQRQANEIVSAAQIQTNELVSEHQIMQQAYAKANEVVMIAAKDAEERLNAATTDANEIRRSAIQYTDDLLAKFQEVLKKSIDTTRTKQNQYLDLMQGYLDTVVSNRMQLNPNPVIEEDPIPVKPEIINNPEPIEVKSEDMVDTITVPSGEDNLLEGVIDIPEQFFKKD